MDIRSYLCREAAALTGASLEAIRSAEDWRRERPKRLARYLDSLGLTPYLEAPRTPLNVKVTGVVERKGYRIEKLYYESLPRLYVSANLYVPNQIAGVAPAVAYFCGHARTQKIHYQSHPRRWCQLGFVALVVDTIQRGEIKSYHHGCYRYGRFHWYSRGYSPAGVECWNGIRALDLLAERPEVDAERMGITGISGGGGMSWWLGAADERARAVAPVCGTGTLQSHVEDRSVDNHCDCMFHINTDLWDLADIGALIAPRPLLVGSANRDGLYKIEAVRETVGKIARLYELLGAGGKARLVETPGPHSYHEDSRTRIFSLFLKALAGRDVPPEKVGDINPGEDEKDGVLRVYVKGLPPDERVTTIDEDFIPRAQVHPLKNQAALEKRRNAVRARLRELSFHHFPQTDPAPDVKIEQLRASATAEGFRFHFTGEAGWRLPGYFSCANDLSAPRGVLLALRSPGEPRWATEGFVGGTGARWAHAFIQTRGVGEVSWGGDLAWHVRRASAILGRTVASMRVYDTLRALAAVRSLDGVHPERLALAARGEMAPVALYAALLDGRVRAVVLGDPPATQDAPSQPDGRGSSIEMLSCLRVTDLAEAAALLWPAELVFVGQRPESYVLAEETYRRLGAPGAVRRLKELNDWRLDPQELPEV